MTSKLQTITNPQWLDNEHAGQMLVTEFLEPEAPFGESTGYIAEKLLNPYFEVKCITHRKNPILATIISGRVRRA